MAGRGMGAATKGGGAVSSGPRNRMISQTSKTTGPVMMAKGGLADKKGRAMDKGGKDAGGRAMKKYRKGGMACK
jgi:hypothetical protein